MTTRMFGFDVTERSRNGATRHERVVLRGDDERGHTDAIDDAHRAGAVIVVGCVLEAEVRRRVDLVELTHGSDCVETIDGEPSREASVLAAHPRLQSTYEIPLVDEVLPPLESANAGLELHHR